MTRQEFPQKVIMVYPDGYMVYMDGFWIGDPIEEEEEIEEPFDPDDPEYRGGQL
jgi:hypothetical protein